MGLPDRLAVALAGLLASVTGCASGARPAGGQRCGPPPVRPPLGLDGVVLDERDAPAPEQIDLERAVELSRVGDDAKGDRQWLFLAFDGCWLDFAVARLVRNPQAGVRPWGRLLVERRIRVARTPEAEARLGVGAVVASYERPADGIRAGMAADEVRALLGPPARVEELGPVGSFDWIYPERRIRFLSGKVSQVEKSPGGAPRESGAAPN